MPCNLNFNQCNTGRQYPIPRFNCAREFVALFNQSTIEIVNPTPVTAFSILNISNAHIVNVGENVVPTSVSSQGFSILYDNAGNFTLAEGRYIITYSFSSVLSNDGSLGFGIYLDNDFIISSQSLTSGNAGFNSNVTNSVLIEVIKPSGQITFKNVGNVSGIVNGGNITIQRVF